jgi:hypothetical protein
MATVQYLSWFFGVAELLRALKLPQVKRHLTDGRVA